MDWNKIFEEENVVVASVSGDPLTDMYLTGSTIQEAAKDPRAIGCLMVDMVYGEGKNPEGDVLYYERNTNKRRYLEQFETGMEDMFTGGWVRVVTPGRMYEREKTSIKQLEKIGRVKNHGTYRGVKLIEFR